VQQAPPWRDLSSLTHYFLMTTSISKTGARVALCILACSAASAFAQTYTIKVGGAYIDPRATSSALEGTLPFVHPTLGYRGNVSTTDGIQLEVQKKNTLVISIERAFNENWSAELVFGYPPKHDVKLRASNPTVVASPLPSTAAANGVAAHVAADDGHVVATVRQWAPTLFLNYTFGDASQSLRPFVGAGVNYTRFKASSNEVGNALYSDGPVRIDLTDSIGLAFHLGANYKLDKHWLVNASWSTAAVKNNMTIRTTHTQQNAFYRFHPSVFSLMVGYAY
jgi:outer membrane protein